MYPEKICYSWTKGIKKSLIGMFLIALPLVIDFAPAFIDRYSNIFDLTLGGILLLGLNYVKIYLKNKTIE